MTPTAGVHGQVADRILRWLSRSVCLVSKLPLLQVPELLGSSSRYRRVPYKATERSRSPRHLSGYCRLLSIGSKFFLKAWLEHINTTLTSNCVSNLRKYQVPLASATSDWRLRPPRTTLERYLSGNGVDGEWPGVGLSKRG